MTERYAMDCTDIAKLRTTIRIAHDTANEVPTVGTAQNEKYAAKLRETAALLRGGLKLIEQITKGDASNGIEVPNGKAA